MDDIVYETEKRTHVPSIDGPKHEWVAKHQRAGWTVLELNSTADTPTRETGTVFELSRRSSSPSEGRSETAIPESN